MLTSIIIPTYNRANLLQKAVDSVLQQTAGQLELLVLDDGSTDHTAELMQSYRDPRLRYFKLEHCGRLAVLRNKGITWSQGSHIAFLDSDDSWLADKLEKQLRSMQEQNAYVSFTGYALCSEKNGPELSNTYARLMNNPHENLLHTFMRNQFVVYPSTFLFHRNCLALAGPLNEKLYHADHDFIARIMSHHKTMVIPEELVLILKHENNLSSTRAIDPYREYLHTLKGLYAQRKINLSILLRSGMQMYYKIFRAQLKQSISR